MKLFFSTLALVFAFSNLAHANVLGEMHTFAPNTDGLDFITVHSAKPLPKSYFAFSNYFNYAKDHLIVYRTLNQQDLITYSNELTEYDFGISYGVTENFQLSLMAPLLTSYTGETNNGLTVDVSRGVHSYRPGFKYSFAQSATQGFAVLGSIDFPQVIDSPYVGTNPKPIFNMELAYNINSQGSSHGFNIGFRKRTPGDVPVGAHMFPLKDQLTTSYGYSTPISKMTKLVAEAFMSYPLDKSPYNKASEASSLDVLLALKHFWWKYLRFDWGVTVEPGLQTQSPAYRGFVGLVYYWKNGLESETENPNQMQQGPEEFSVEPRLAKIRPFERQGFQASGGQSPYKCQMLQGEGQLNPKTCIYEAPETATHASIEFSDAQNQKIVSEVEVADTNTNGELQIDPQSEEIYEGSTLQFRASGGQAPYKFSIADGGGRVSNTGFFRAPLQPGVSSVQVIDNEGQFKVAQIRVVAVPKADENISLKNLQFITATDRLTPLGNKMLRKNISELKKVKLQQIVIEGHTDSVGNAEYNQDLSERRAQTVRKILAELLDFPLKSIKAVGYGEERPITSNETADGRQHNRRVEIRFYYSK